MLTIHAYRSWNADNPTGYVRRKKGVLPPDPEMASNYDKAARFDRVRFTSDLQSMLIEGSRDICKRRDWRLHQVVIASSHLHAVVSWRDAAVDCEKVRDTFKRVLGWMLAKHTKRLGRKWFSRGGPPRQVTDREHFEYLMLTYLPKHACGMRGGSGWCERRGYYGRLYQARAQSDT